ncbi:MAG: glycosyltransferase family 4 protein, partial [Gemmatimonadetes bacterium]|nr:glycosyltransferase family 4 protein [Gemmatimonadota bacterium]
MRILIFNYEYPPLGGGGGVVNALIAEELAQRHSVSVITSAFGELPREQTWNGVEIHRVPVLSRGDTSVGSLMSLVSYPPAAWLAAARILRRERFDLINSHFAVPTGPGSLLPARVADIPHVVSIHGGDIYNPASSTSPHRLWGVRWTVASVLRNSDAVIAASNDTRDNAVRYYGHKGPIDVIPHGIKVPEVPPATRAELDLPEGVFLAVTVGRLVRRKAIDCLLKALVKPECAEVHLVVVGTGPELTSLENLANRLHVRDRVYFTGHVGETRKWQTLKVSDAYVSSTKHEGFGLVYLEAMAAGLPIVTFDRGGQVDFLRDGETGYLVAADDQEALVRALARLVASPDVAARMRRTNLARSEQYTIERCAREHEILFEEIIARRGGAGARDARSRPPGVATSSPRADGVGPLSAMSGSTNGSDGARP